ncbi:Est1 DNA/RNA binding domain-containing protein [Scheffersomyces coipomensis]|uniref:Est1 DNA/RNA binding domain-containing protein n=1 Tax=Scheffersomyces coipomensis TaxID=1788519 RepID=UPI00315DA8BD
MEFQSEIDVYKTQLQELLGRKYLDQSLLIGFNSIIQSKFQTWITNDFNEYFTNSTQPSSGQSESASIPNNQPIIEFNTMDYLKCIWSEFHYPVIKFFQKIHSEYFNDTQSEFKKLQGQGSANKFKVKPVEIRKFNDNFVKFTKLIYQFYINILTHFSTNYKASLLPRIILVHFKLKLTPNAVEIKDANVQANLVYLIHKCLLSLGDISRHRTFIEVSYVIPCISNKDFFKYRNMSNKEKAISFNLRLRYEKSVQFYKICILLLPALNEPYNHIGMIYNLIDEKFNALLWFLRSQFTRIPNYNLGLSNLNSVIKKKWFLTNLCDINFEDLSTIRRNKNSLTIEDDLNNTLVCLIGYFYYPDVYKKGPNLVKDLKFSKIETQFFHWLNMLFHNLIISRDTDGYYFFIKQLIIVFGFNKLTSEENSENIQRFALRYIERLLDIIVKQEINEITRNPILICVRFILTWLKENKNVSTSAISRGNTLSIVSAVLNLILKDTQSFPHPLDLPELRENIKSGTRPVRAYYFEDDVIFKDFSLIKYQFKDFKDDNLFKANNINLLCGDYTEFLREGKLPTFLDSPSTEKEVEKDADTNAAVPEVPIIAPETIRAEIYAFELGLRANALLVLGGSIYTQKSGGLYFDHEIEVFAVKKVDVIPAVAAKTVRANKSDKSTKRSINYRTDTNPKVYKNQGKSQTSKESSVSTVRDSSQEINSPDSMKDIEETILNHTNILHKQLEESASPEPEPEDVIMLNPESNPIPQKQQPRSRSIWNNNNAPQDNNIHFKIPSNLTQNGENDDTQQITATTSIVSQISPSPNQQIISQGSQSTVSPYPQQQPFNYIGGSLPLQPQVPSNAQPIGSNLPVANVYATYPQYQQSQPYPQYQVNQQVPYYPPFQAMGVPTTSPDAYAAAPQAQPIQFHPQSQPLGMPVYDQQQQPFPFPPYPTQPPQLQPQPRPPASYQQQQQQQSQDQQYQQYR